MGNSPQKRILEKQRNSNSFSERHSILRDHKLQVVTIECDNLLPSLDPSKIIVCRRKCRADNIAIANIYQAAFNIDNSKT
jgi:hypothetical protein